MILEDMAGPNQYMFYSYPNNPDDSGVFAVRKGYRRGYQEFGVAAKLHPDRYRNSDVTILTREEIDKLYPPSTLTVAVV